jgi:endonuclease-3
LPGVGRKTANVVLSITSDFPAIAVDTHVFRVSNRIGLARAKDVVKTEEDLMKNIPRDKWSDAHHWLIWHGRKICQARKPDCSICFLNHICLYNNS